MPRPDASADPLGAVPEPSFSQNSNSNHSSSAGVPTTTDTSVMRSQSLDSKSSSLLQLIAENIDRSVRGRTPSTDLWLRYPLSSDGLGALQDLIRENPHWNDKVRYDTSISSSEPTTQTTNVNLQVRLFPTNLNLRPTNAGEFRTRELPGRLLQALRKKLAPTLRRRPCQGGVRRRDL